MKTLCITVDVDRDVNDVKPGCVQSISIDRGDGTKPRFQSSRKGTELFIDLFDDLGVEATYFAEARTLSNLGNMLTGKSIGLHGLDHEDFTGEKTGVRMDVGEKREIIERAISIIRDYAGKQPKGFRFPYMSVDEETLSFLPEYGIKYDSSYYTYLDGRMTPYRLDNGIVEFPVPKANDANGKSITSYLWPMHEGIRKPKDFTDILDKVEDGVFVLATHSWHICESRKRGVMDGDEISVNIDNMKTIIDHALDTGFKVKTMDQIISEM